MSAIAISRLSEIEDIIKPAWDGFKGTAMERACGNLLYGLCALQAQGNISPIGKELITALLEDFVLVAELDVDQVADAHSRHHTANDLFLASQSEKH